MDSHACPEPLSKGTSKCSIKVVNTFNSVFITSSIAPIKYYLKNLKFESHYQLFPSCSYSDAILPLSHKSWFPTLFPRACSTLHSLNSIPKCFRAPNILLAYALMCTTSIVLEGETTEFWYDKNTSGLTWCMWCSITNVVVIQSIKRKFASLCGDVMISCRRLNKWTQQLRGSLL